ncbi:MAG: carboxylesterase family protein, partial [Cyclobacteriaceae bacterium]
MKILVTALLTFLMLTGFSQSPVIKTENGLISGIKKGDVSIFKGVPFADPPVGDLRWKAPQPVTNWSGTLKCENFSASPVQGKPVPFMMWTEEFISPPEPLSEDCLYLNIWTKGKTKNDKLPVLVWIYGGGFVSGSAACAVYDGEELAKQGIVFVSINYRVGPFGFLAHPELTKESGTKSSGNYAFLDQLAALRWLQTNIAAFGGDPGNVTIAGQSAGSFSINALVASPLGKGLFHKAIAQSGGFLGGSIGKKLPQAEKSGIVFAQKANVAGLTELRKMSAEEIQRVATLMGRDAFSPVLEDYVLPSNLLTHFQQGKHNDAVSYTH